MCAGCLSRSDIAVTNSSGTYSTEFAVLRLHVEADPGERAERRLEANVIVDQVAYTVTELDRGYLVCPVGISRMGAPIILSRSPPIAPGGIETLARNGVLLERTTDVMLNLYRVFTKTDASSNDAPIQLRATRDKLVNGGQVFYRGYVNGLGRIRGSLTLKGNGRRILAQCGVEDNGPVEDK